VVFGERIKMFHEFVGLTTYRRKHVVRVLRKEFNPAREVSLRNRVYDEAVAPQVRKYSVNPQLGS
jgi:hypothetical protein